MPAGEPVTASPIAATARAGTGTPTVHVKAGTLAAGAMASAPAPTVTVFGPLALVYAVPAPHYHVPAKHDDLIQYGSELLVVVVFVLVAWRVVACRRLLRATPPGLGRIPPS